MPRAHPNIVVVPPNICSCSLLLEVLLDSDYDAEECQNSRNVPNTMVIVLVCEASELFEPAATGSTLAPGPSRGKD
jgi:hypothetical protein